MSFKAKFRRHGHSRRRRVGPESRCARGIKYTVPIAEFCRNPAISDVQLSPSGARIAFLKLEKGRQNLFVQTGANGVPENVTAEADWDVTGYFWKGDRYLIYRTDAGNFRFDLELRKLGLLGFEGGYRFVGIVDELKWNSDDELLVELVPPGKNLSDVYRVNVCFDNLKPRLVAKHPNATECGIIRKWIVDHTGEVSGAISVKGTNDCLLTRSEPTGPFKIARTMDFSRSIEDQFYPYLFYTADHKGIYAIARTNRRRNTAAVVLLSAKSGREMRCVYHNHYWDPQSIGFSRNRGVVTDVSFYNIKLRHKALDSHTARIFKVLRRLLRDNEVEIVDHDAAERRFIIRACNDITPDKYYFLDCSDGRKYKLTLVGDTAPWLRGRRLSRIRPIKFLARDGLTIHGYLTLPVGRKAKNLPMIVYIHGGPENRNYWSYEHLYSGEVQFLANRGYAVLQPNFRGSIGYGRSFWTKGFMQRGRKMQDDITDGVRWLIKRGIADPKRIAICGKSYGGYAALAGVAFTPDLYRAAVDYSGVSNWLTWLKVFGRTDGLYPQFCVKVGDPIKHRKLLEAVAPALQVDKITKPVFVIHGANDEDVELSESVQMVRALCREGKSVDFKVLKDEGHVFQNEANKCAVYRAVEDFLTQHLA